MGHERKVKAARKLKQAEQLARLQQIEEQAKQYYVVLAKLGHQALGSDAAKLADIAMTMHEARLLRTESGQPITPDVILSLLAAGSVVKRIGDLIAAELAKNPGQPPPDWANQLADAVGQKLVGIKSTSGPVNSDAELEQRAAAAGIALVRRS